MCSTLAANSRESGMQPQTTSTQRQGRAGRNAPISMQKNSARKPVSIRSPSATSANPLIAPNANATAYQGISLPVAGAGVAAGAVVAGVAVLLTSFWLGTAAAD